jgi:NhaP-type Na+/H+ or K+/H+ antiporter
MSNQDVKDRDRATFVAVAILLAVFVGLLLGIALVFPNMLAIFAIVFGGGILIGFQYLIWGRWLMGYLKARVPDDTEEEEEFLKKYGPQ